MDGQKLKMVLRTNEAMLLLDRLCGFPGCGWTSGGCQILAKSLKMLLPEGDILVVWNNRQDQAEHCVFSLGGRVYDGDGLFDLDRFAAAGFPRDYDGSDFSLLPYEPDACTDFPNAWDSTLADFLAQRLDIHEPCVMV